MLLKSCKKFSGETQHRPDFIRKRHISARWRNPAPWVHGGPSDDRRGALRGARKLGTDWIHAPLSVADHDGRRRADSDREQNPPQAAGAFRDDPDDVGAGVEEI